MAVTFRGSHHWDGASFGPDFKITYDKPIPEPVVLQLNEETGEVGGIRKPGRWVVGMLRGREGVDVLRGEEGVLRGGEGVGMLRRGEGVGVLRSRERGGGGPIRWSEADHPSYPPTHPPPHES